ncbi:MAG: redox-regulated ATPase YchF [Candidatus Komeilibacteria bacterium RIFCSPLOWO2_01_FULL_53_11]|uniref:Ribosome-binding ATPase YchF n=1 Tax=Candidatus Komeilibacteria bacterium RIFCSPLOWO2_01_FULL_53_11 TaxID=1798552 RepID=A0A1G2BVA6_9BACT|nr:MAG: redox-regulated ATPase YchF [Candidatus Komeilibacteria bacterium RIFCSPLOWO2_01_FULL_53_11]
MSFSLGIVGLPNVGKSTIFQALTKKKVDASNYPFCTIDPNVGVVAVPDERLAKLAAMSRSEKIIPTTIEFVDIAGLVKGASQGEGLGNKFLNHIREVNALVEVVRVFPNPDVIHVHGAINPDDDRQVINLELILADLEIAEKRLERVRTQLKGPQEKTLLAEAALLEKVVHRLKSNTLLHDMDLTDAQATLMRQHNFLTYKPLLYVHNIGESDIKNKITLPENTIAMCGKLESELAEVPENELPEYLRQLELSDTGLNQLIQKSYELLNLITFITTGPKDTRAWTVVEGAKAPQAAGVIHTDFEKGFIRAEVINWEELLRSESWVHARELGKIRIEGKEYLVQDGDVVHFHFQ